MDETHACARSVIQVDASKSTRLHRFRLMLGDETRSFRNKSKVDCSTRRISTVHLSMENGLSSSAICYQDLSHWKHSRRSRGICQIKNIEPEHFEGRISYSEQVKNYAKIFSQRHWSCLGPRDEEKWYGAHTCNPERKWNSIAAEMVRHFKETGHPVFKGISASNGGILKRNSADVLYISMRIRRTQSFCFAQSTHQTSSATAEQCQAGVKSWLSGFRVKTS